MKKLLALCFIIILLVIAGVVGYRQLNTPTVVITITDDAYVPQNVTIKKGTRVTFKNDGTIGRWPASDLHPTHGIYPEFDSLDEVAPGKEWSFRFDKVGKWQYHDHLDPQIDGIITVEE